MKKIKSMLKNKSMQKVIVVLLALFVTIAFNLSLDIIESNDIKDINNHTNYFTKIMLKLEYSLDKNIFESFLLFVCLNLLFGQAFFREDVEKKGRKIYKIILSILFSFFMVFGYSYMKINSGNMIFKNTFQLAKAIIKGMGYYIIFRAFFNYLFDILLENINIKKKHNKVYHFIFVKHPFMIPLLIILICWLPYIIALYPGTLFQDSSNQIKQYFGYDVPEESSTNSVNLIDEKIKITNHHPVVHTVILGLCIQFGKLVGSDNVGIFTYTILQVILFASTLAYVISFMRKLNIPNWIRIVSLMIYALTPIIPIYAMEITKDIPFTCFIIMYIIQIYGLIKNANIEKITIKKSILIVTIAILISLFRNNGIYAIIMSLPILAIIDKMNRKKILIVSMIVIILCEAFTSILLPVLKIPSASVREALSIPFQQTARYVKKYGSEVTEEEKEIIDKVLDYDTLSERYNPLTADPVKNEYNKNATKEDLSNYLKIWFHQFLKHPTVYVQATMNNIYGYFYPESKIRQYTTDFVIDSHQAINVTGEFHYQYVDQFKPLRKLIKVASDTIQKIPGISWIINIAFNVWIIITILVYLLYTKRYRYIIYLMPFISLILVCIASPVNAYYRYAISYIFAMPLTISILIDIVEEGKKESEK